MGFAVRKMLNRQLSAAWDCWIDKYNEWVDYVLPKLKLAAGYGCVFVRVILPRHRPHRVLALATSSITSSASTSLFYTSKCMNLWANSIDFDRL